VMVGISKARIAALASGHHVQGGCPAIEPTSKRATDGDGANLKRKAANMVLIAPSPLGCRK
jgi:hypothetical protein